MARVREYSQNEETANAGSHALGILLGITGGYILLKASGDNYWAITSVLIYLFGMLSCYFVSTWYHASKNIKRKRILQKLDHASIYLHIAGSYTPFTLVTLRNEGFWGWGLFAFVWLFAIVGISLSFRKYKKHSHLETICYIGMGCAVLAVLNPLLNVLSENGKMELFYWLIGGGVSYIIGALFYSWTKRPYMHTVFHIFVFMGSLCHVRAIFLAVNG